jgi:hypothetical protein
MELTDAEREEFTRLANATLDPDLWSEEDLPALRAARAEHEKELEPEKGDDVPLATENDNQDGEDSDPALEW